MQERLTMINFFPGSCGRGTYTRYYVHFTYKVLVYARTKNSSRRKQKKSLELIENNDKEINFSPDKNEYVLIRIKYGIKI